MALRLPHLLRPIPGRPATISRFQKRTFVYYLMISIRSSDFAAIATDLEDPPRPAGERIPARQWGLTACFSCTRRVPPKYRGGVTLTSVYHTRRVDQASRWLRSRPGGPDTVAAEHVVQDLRLQASRGGVITVERTFRRFGHSYPGSVWDCADQIS
jgi:hypothetical protein